MDSERREFLERRRKGIGGSDVAAILGLSPWSTPLSVYMQKVEGWQDENENEAMYWGSVLEEPVARRWSEETGKKIRRKNARLVHPIYDELIANIDRDVVGEKALLEVKTANAFKATDWDDAVPDHYLTQCLHYLNVTKNEKCYLAVLIGGSQFKRFVVHYDQELINQIQQRCVDFWQDHVIKKVPPPPTGLDIDRKILDADFVEPQDSAALSLSSDYLKWVEQYRYAKDQKSHFKELEEEAKNNLIAGLHGHREAEIKGNVIKYSKRSRTNFNSKKFQEDHPKMAAEYTNKSTFNVLTVKEKKS